MTAPTDATCSESCCLSASGFCSIYEGLESLASVHQRIYHNDYLNLWKMLLYLNTKYASQNNLTRMIHGGQLGTESCAYQITKWAEDLAMVLTPWYEMQQPGPCHSTPLPTPSLLLNMGSVPEGASWAGWQNSNLGFWQVTSPHWPCFLMLIQKKGEGKLVRPTLL